MNKQPVSIFNDVIGPVMRGPSSSHTAASARIGRLARQMLKGNLKKVIVKFDPKGSLATTYEGHGSDIGLVGGLLGYEPQDPRLVDSLEIAKKQGLNVSFEVVNYEALHPNTYRMTLISDNNERINTTSISTGGGMILFEEINGFKVSIGGDFYETLIYTHNATLKNEIEQVLIKNEILVDYMDLSFVEDRILINIKTGQEISKHLIEALEGIKSVDSMMILKPVVPILSSKTCEVPFSTSTEMLLKNSGQEPIWALAAMYESARGNISRQAVFEKMKSIVNLMDTSIKSGLQGTVHENRLLKQQSHLIDEALGMNKLLPGQLMNTTIQYITAMMEVKSAMGVIVAAPTAGSCGVLPGTIIGACNTMELSLDIATKGMLAGGLIGMFIAEHGTFAAEVGGCQVECGAGSAMAAAGLVEIMGGSAQQAVDAASMALQNLLGMVCDPVANGVEVPCLGKNVMAGVNAIACANMALSGFDKVVPLDETIDAMYKVGLMLPSELRCTGKGGLSVTPTALKLTRNLKEDS